MIMMLARTIRQILPRWLSQIHLPSSEQMIKSTATRKIRSQSQSMYAIVNPPETACLSAPRWPKIQAQWIIAQQINLVKYRAKIKNSLIKSVNGKISEEKLGALNRRLVG